MVTCYMSKNKVSSKSVFYWDRKNIKNISCQALKWPTVQYKPIRGGYRLVWVLRIILKTSQAGCITRVCVIRFFRVPLIMMTILLEG
jgi:hypothetical protein